MTATPRALRAVEAVFFDLDGTLLRDDRSDEVVRLVAIEVARRHREVDADRLAAANQRVWADYWPEVGVAWLCGRLPTDAVPLEVWRRSLIEVGVAEPDGAAREAFAVHAALEGAAFELYPESREVLAALRAQGIRTALITNGPTGLQRAKLSAVGLADAFDAVVVSGEIGVHKPDAAIFAAALGAVGADAATTIHVGDDIAADIGGARGAGLSPVWINRMGAAAPSEPAPTITDLRQLLPMIARGASR